MEKIIFACDIDNTLIFSKKHPHEGWPCVEWIHEKEQAYMSPRTIELLNALPDHVLLMPVTSRSLEQFTRIQWPMRDAPRFSITTHGARLFIDHVEDEQWRLETKAIIDPWVCELQRMEAILAPDPSFIRCRMVDDSYLFVYCSANVDPIEIGRRLHEMTSLTICIGGKKLYLLPPNLNKGTAMDRLRLRFPQHRIIAAGDSEMDLDMLNRADLAIYPEKMASLVSASGIICPSGTLLSEFVVEKLHTILRS